MATIQVFFKPIVDQFGDTLPYFHEFLVYTPDNGTPQFLRGGPQSRTGFSFDGGSGSNGSGSGSGSNGGANFPWGKIVTLTGDYTATASAQSPDSPPAGVTYQSQTITTGSQSQLQPLWNEMVADAAVINQNNYAYSATGPNSNSVVNTLLSDVGLPLPQNEGLGQQYAAPGSNIPLNASTSVVQTQLEAVLANLGNANTPLVAAVEEALLSTGYYMCLSGDTAQSIFATFASDGISTTTFDSATLLRINAPFGVTGYTTGTLLHVPVDSKTVALSVGVDFSLSLATLPPSKVYVYDPSSAKVFTVGASLDGHDSGSLIIDTPVFGGFASFAQGTYSGLTLQANGNIAVDLTTTNGIPLGTFSFNPSSDAGTLTILDGLSFPISVSAATHLTSSTGTPEQVLLADLSAVGDPLTSAQLNQDNDNFLNPSATPVTVQGTVSGDLFTQQVLGKPSGEFFFSTTNDATINGLTSAPVNVLRASGDMVGDTITNMQVLEAGTDITHLNLTLTAAQFNSFAYVTNYGGGPAVTLTIAGGGTVSLQSSNVFTNPAYGQYAANFNLAASGWEGTTLIGNNISGQYLTASEFGNDTLTAGNGTGDTLTAGEGVDTLTGSTAGQTAFFANNGLAAGSVVRGFGAGNSLTASGDISGATITGVQTLVVQGTVTLNGTEFGAFSSISPSGSSPTIAMATSGTYNLANETTASINMAAGSASGTTLIGNNANGEALTASQSGNDTLQAGNGSSDTLNGGGGNDTLIAGTGSDTFNGGVGYTTYKFGSSFGQDVINNAAGGATIATGEIDFSSGVNFKNLWFKQSGNDLVIQLLGTSDTITVSGWFGSNAGAQVLAFYDASGNSLSNSQVSALVNAMATYQTNNPSFSAATATSLPTNNALQIATAYAWTGKTYSSVTVNGDGSWSGVVTDTSGGNWTSVTDNYSASNVRVSTVELFNNGSSFTITYGTNGANNTYAVSGTLPSGAVVGAVRGSNTVTLGNVTGVTIESYGSAGNNTETIQDTLSNNPGANYNNTLDASTSSGNNSLTVGDGSYDLLRTDWSTGTNSLTAGNGSHDWLDAESSTGVNTLTVGSGTNNTLDVSFSSGNDTLQTVNGSSDYLNASSSKGNNTLSVGNGNSNTLDVSFSSGNNVVTAGNGNGDYLNANSSTGNNVLTAGSGANDTFSAVWSTGQNTFNAGTGNTTLLGGEGYTTYKFGAAFGQDTLWNSGSSSGQGASAVQGEIDFTSSSITYNNLWFTQSGNDLVVQLLGTSDTITVKGWFGSNAGAEVQTFNTTDGLKLPSGQVASLVSAMATYQSANPSFNPATATSMPANSALQAALTAGWFSAVGTTGIPVATAQADQSVLDGFSGGYKVVDTAANVAAALAFLTSDASHIASIVLTDSATPTLALTAAQYSADSAALGKITSAYNLSVSGVTAANAATVAGAAHVVSLAVSDTAANVVANIASLNTLASGGKLSAITLTDSTTPTISLTSTQISNDAAALQLITSSYDLLNTSNSTTTYYIGNGVQTTFTQSNTTVVAGTGVGLNMGGNNDSVTLGANSWLGISGTSDTVNAASGDTINLGGNSQVTVTSTGDTINLGAGENLTASGSQVNLVVGNTSETIVGNNDTVAAASGITGITMNMGASNDNITLNGGSSIGITGTGDTINAASGDTVNLGSSSQVTVNMAGGTVNLGAQDTLTTSGNTVNLVVTNTQDTVTGTGDTINTSAGDTVNLGSGTQASIIGNGNTVTALTGATGIGINMGASNDTITLNGSSWVSISGTGDTINAAAGDTINLGGGAQVTVTSTGDTINLGASENLTASGSQINLVVGNTSETIVGNYDTVAAASGITGITMNMGANNDNITLNGSSSLGITGTGDTVSAASGDTINVGGNSQITVATSGDNVNLGTSDSVTASGDTVTMVVSNTTATINGSNNTIGAGSGISGLTINLDGTNQSVNLSSTQINLAAPGTSATIVGNSDTVAAASGVTGISLNMGASNDSVTLNGSSAVSISGTGDTINAASGDTINLGGGSQVTVTSTGDTINLGAGENLTASGSTINLVVGNTSETIIGNNDTVAAASGITGITMNMGASNDTITLNGGSSVGITGTGDTINAANGDTVNLGGSSQVTVNMTGGTVNLGASDTVAIGAGSTGDTINNTTTTAETYSFGSNFGQDTINNGTGSAAKGQVNFTSANANQLWFQQSGNNLLVDVLGTSNQIILSGWYANASDQVAQFDSADGLKLDTQTAALVAEMATYAANNPGFNPQTATSMPTALQTDIAAAWHT